MDIKNIFKNKIIKRLIFCLLSALFLLLFLFPRSVDILNHNPLFTFDQGREYLAARNIVVNHKFILIGTELGAGSAGINGVFHGPGYYYFLTIPFIIFNGDPAGGTVLIFLFNALCVAFLYYFVKKIVGFWPAVSAVFLFAISPLFISQARFLWSPNPPGLFILLSYYFTYLFFEKKNLYVFLSAFFAAFVYNFEMGIAIPMVISLMIYSIYYFRGNFRKYFFLIFGFLIGFLPMILFELRHNFLGLRGILTYIFEKKTIQGSAATNFLLDHFNAIIYNLNDTFGIARFVQQGWVFYLPTLIMLILVLVYFNKEKNKDIKSLILYFLITIVTTFAVFFNLRNALYSYYLTDLSLIYLIFLSYIFYSSRKQKTLWLTICLSLFITSLVLVAIPLQIKTSIYDFHDYGGTAKLKGKMDAIDYIYKDAKGKPFGLLVFSPPVYTYPYDYIIQWYGQNKYHYIPYKDKKGVFYLLIEKDPEKPWSYKGWLDTVIKSGKIDYTKTLKSGFIIQKRHLPW